MASAGVKARACLPFAAVTPGIHRFNLADHAVTASSKDLGAAAFIFDVQGRSWLAYIEAVAEGKVPLD